jgi:hypothetical protein
LYSVYAEKISFRLQITQDFLIEDGIAERTKEQYVTVRNIIKRVEIIAKERREGTQKII